MAQPERRLAEVAVGFRGVPVAEAWNPVRLTVRDVGSGSLTLVVDQGSLRDGEIVWTTTLPVAGGAGVQVLEADVYLPSWRTLRWSLEAGGALVASGAWPREAADRRPVDLVISDRPGEVAERLGGRVVDVPAADLPRRAAAYDGVRSIWFDGSVPTPDPAALTAAAAAGAIVVAFDAAAEDPRWAGLLPADAWTGIGAGGAWTGEQPSSAALERGRIDLRAWTAAFAAAGGVPVPARPPVEQVVAPAALYALLVVLSWRVGGGPGLATWLVLVIGATALAATSWRPAGPTVVEVRSLHVGAGGLALRQRAHDVLTLPAAEVRIAVASRPAAAAPGRTSVGSPPLTTVGLARWRGSTLIEAPQATPALLGWTDDGLPRALSDRVLTDVRVIDGPAWADVRPGDVLGALRDPHPLAGAEAAFEALLPSGAVWARSGSDWHVALPVGVRW